MPLSFWIVAYLAVAAATALYCYLVYPADHPESKKATDVLRSRGFHDPAVVRLHLMVAAVVTGLMWPLSIPTEIVVRLKNLKARMANRAERARLDAVQALLQELRTEDPRVDAVAEALLQYEITTWAQGLPPEPRVFAVYVRSTGDQVEALVDEPEGLNTLWSQAVDDADDADAPVASALTEVASQAALATAGEIPNADGDCSGGGLLTYPEGATLYAMGLRGSSTAGKGEQTWRQHLLQAVSRDSLGWMVFHRDGQESVPRVVPSEQLQGEPLVQLAALVNAFLGSPVTPSEPPSVPSAGGPDAMQFAGE